jgi:hypothetical protein
MARRMCPSRVKLVGGQLQRLRCHLTLRDLGVGEQRPPVRPSGCSLTCRALGVVLDGVRGDELHARKPLQQDGGAEEVVLECITEES